MGKQFNFSVLLLPLAALLLLSSCEGGAEFANSPPSGLKITRSKCYIWTGGELTLEGEAEDGDGDPLTFTWSCGAGSFTPANGEGETVVWTAPDLPGDVVITMKVSDEIDDRTLSISVDVGEKFPILIFGNQEFTDRGYPYILTNSQPVNVSSSSRLTLGPGVILVVDSEFGGLDVQGTLTVDGRRNDMVNIGPNSCAGVDAKWGGIYLSGEEAVGQIKHMNIYESTDGIQINQGAVATIDSCNITDTDEVAISVLYGSSAFIEDCKVWDNGGGLFVVNSDFSIRTSSLRYNVNYGVGVEVITDIGADYDMLIEECLVANNGANGITLVGEARPEIHRCSLYFNGPEQGVGYAVRLMSYTGRDSVHAEENYWGVTSQDEIEDQIFDANDSPGSIQAFVGFIPWLDVEPLRTYDRATLRESASGKR